MYYLLYLSLIVYPVKRFSTPLAALLLLTGLTLQVADLKINRPFHLGQTSFTRHLKSEKWPEVIRPFETIAVVPPFELSVGGKNDYVDFAFLAATHHKKVTSGVLVRIPGDLERVTQALIEEALRGPRDPDTLYVFSAKGPYRTEPKPGLRCLELDAYLACYRSDLELNFSWASKINAF